MPVPRILYFEDDDNDAEMLAFRLAEEGIEIDLVRAESPAALMLALRDGPPAAVITDSEILGFTAAAVIRAVRVKHPEVPVVCFTGLVTERKAALPKEAGIEHLVQKNNITELLAFLKMQLGTP